MNENENPANEPETSILPSDREGVQASVGSPRTVPIEELFERLIQAMPWPKPELLQEIAARGDEALPILKDRLNRLTEFLKDQDKIEDEQYNEVFFYCGLLDMIYVSEGVEPLVSVIRTLASKHGGELYDFFDTVFLSLERFGGDVADSFMEIARDETLLPSVRSSAMEYAFSCVADDPVLQTRVIAECMNLLEPVLTRGTMAGLHPPLRLFYSKLTSSLASTASPLAREVLNTLVKMEGFIHSSINQEELDRFYEMGPTFGDEDEDEDEDGSEQEATWITEYREQYRDYDRPFRRQSIWTPLLSAIVDRQHRLDRYEVGNVPIADASPPSAAKIAPSTRPAAFPAPLAPPMPNPSFTPLKPFRNTTPQRGRNEKCWCGSGKKYKNCHLRADQSETPADPEADAGTGAHDEANNIATADPAQEQDA